MDKPLTFPDPSDVKAVAEGYAKVNARVNVLHKVMHFQARENRLKKEKSRIVSVSRMETRPS